MIGRWTVLATTLMTLATPASGFAQASATKSDARGDCVYINQLGDSRPLGDRSVVFRANVSDFYRMDFAQRCPMLTFPQPKVIMTPFGGIGLICHALDVDVRVGDQGPDAFAAPCIPSAWHKMTPAEIAAVPKKDLP